MYTDRQTGPHTHTHTHSLAGREPRWAVFVLERAACCLWQRCQRRQRPRRPQRPFAAILRSLWQHFGSKANDADNVHDSNGRGKTKKKMLLRRVRLVMFHKAAIARGGNRGRQQQQQQPQRKNHFKQKQQGKCTKRLRALQFPSSARTCNAPVCACVCVRRCVCVCVSQCLPTFASLTGNFRRLCTRTRW